MYTDKCFNESCGLFSGIHFKSFIVFLLLMDKIFLTDTSSDDTNLIYHCFKVVARGKAE